MLDAPSHHIFVVHRPGKYRSPSSFRIAEEISAPETHEGFLQEIERYIRDRKKLPRVRDGEANVADLE